METLLDNKKSGNWIVGNLPHEWIDTIPKANRNVIRDDIYPAFSNAAHLIRTIKDEAQASNIIGNALVKSGITSKFEGLQYIVTGNYGLGYFFKINDKKYFMKVFKSTVEEGELNYKHGIHIETNRLVFYNKWEPNGEYAKLIWSDLNKENGGYYIAEFIDNTTPLPKKFISDRKYGTNADDYKNGDNQINGYRIDGGGIIVTNKYLANSPKLAKKFDNFTKMTLKKKINYLNNELPMKQYRAQFEYTLAHSLDLFSQDNRGILMQAIAPTANRETMAMLLNRLHYISPDQIEGCVNAILKNPDKAAWQDLRFDVSVLNVPNKPALIETIKNAE